MSKQAVERPRMTAGEVGELRRLAAGSGRDVRRQVETRIRAAEKALRRLDGEYALIPKAAVDALVGKAKEIQRWQIRFRTLVEVWELMTDQVWSMRPKAE